jgi:hypothetical protein
MRKKTLEIVVTVRYPFLQISRREQRDLTSIGHKQPEMVILWKTRKQTKRIFAIWWETIY